MKSARDRAIDMYHGLMTVLGGPKMSRELLGMIVKERANEDAVRVVDSIEKEVEEDRRDLLAWEREHG